MGAIYIREQDEDTAHDIRRQRKDDDERDIVDAAMRDLLAGKFDSPMVHAAMKLGHHEGYPRVKELRDTATRVERATA